MFKDDADRQNFLNTLQHVNRRYNWICYAYCLMTNHFHLLIETPDGNLSQGMRQLNGVYTQLFNTLHGRDVPEIPRSQRYVNRPTLEKMFPVGILAGYLTRLAHAVT